MILIDRMVLEIPGVSREDAGRLAALVAGHLQGSAFVGRTIPAVKIALSAPDLPLAVMAWEIAQSLRKAAAERGGHGG